MPQGVRRAFVPLVVAAALLVVFRLAEQRSRSRSCRRRCCGGAAWAGVAPRGSTSARFDFYML